MESKKILGGYYIKARCIQNSVISNAPPHFREIWDWLLKEANHSDQKNGPYLIKRGQCFRSYQDIRDGLAWNVGYRKERYSENQVKKAMKFLRENLMIDTTKALGGVLITICNYERYQNPKNYERTNEGTKERTKVSPSKNQGGPHINKNEENDKNENKKYGEFKNVILSDEEYKKLENKFNGSLKEKIDNLSEGIASKGYKYKSHYATILTWERNRIKKEKESQPKKPQYKEF